LTLNGGFWGAAAVIAGAVTPPSYTVVDLGTQGEGYSEANTLNNSGQIAGRFYYSAAFWNDGSSPGARLGDLSGYSFPTAIGINDSGQIAGYSHIISSGVYSAQFWANSAGSPVMLLPLPGGTNSSYAYGINGSGEIVGFASVINRDSSYSAPVFWGSSTSPPQVLDHPGINNISVAIAINDSEQIVGFAANQDNHSSQATFWANRSASVVTLSPLGASGSSGQAVAINASGQIVGASPVPAGEAAVFWSDSGSDPVALGSLGGGSDSALSINASGQIVGYSSGHAILWPNSTSPPIDLNTVIPSSSGWVLKSANAINNQGEIVGNGIIGGEQHGFAIVPIPSPLRITSVAKSGSSLLLNFNSQAGHTYNIQITPALTTGTWSNLVTEIPGNGGIVQVQIPNAFSQPRQFFRIQLAQ
jgi:uncharacterized membrane protein